MCVYFLRCNIIHNSQCYSSWKALNRNEFYSIFRNVDYSKHSYLYYSLCSKVMIQEQSWIEIKWSGYTQRHTHTRVPFVTLIRINIFIVIYYIFGCFRFPVWIEVRNLTKIPSISHFQFLTDILFQRNEFWKIYAFVGWISMFTYPLILTIFVLRYLYIVEISLIL